MAALLLIALIALALVATPYIFRQFGESVTDRARSMLRAMRAGSMIVLSFLLAVTVLLSSYTQIDNGNVGIVYQFGKIVGQVNSGAHFLPPWQEVTQINIQVQRALFHSSTDRTRV